MYRLYSIKIRLVSEFCVRTVRGHWAVMLFADAKRTVVPPV